MSDGLEQVPKNGFSTKISTPYASPDSVFTGNSENIKNSLLIGRTPPPKSQTYQETADPCFHSIDQDYKQARFDDKKMKGRGSKRLEGFPIIFCQLKAFIEWVNAKRKRVAFEVTVTRRNQYQQDRWLEAKRAFQAELDRLNQQRQVP